MDVKIKMGEASAKKGAAPRWRGDEEDQFERQVPTDDGEYDLFYDYYFPDGNPYDRSS